MPVFLVRKNCEYSITVEAENEDEAVAAAQEVELQEWGSAFSATEAEKAEPWEIAQVVAKK